MLYRVYIIENQDGEIYIGISENMETFPLQRNSGESKWAAQYSPWS